MSALSIVIAVSAGLVDHVCNLFVEIAAICLSSDANVDMKAPSVMLLSLLDTLHAVLKFVSDVVRKALQVRGAGAGLGIEVCH